MLTNEPSPLSQSDILNQPIEFPSRTGLREMISSLKPHNHSDVQREAMISRLLGIARAKRGPLRIGMYDGSFDPPHHGHRETARAAVPIGRLDLLVLNCHQKPSSLKPNLSPHDIRTEMLSSYFPGDPTTIVSPLSRVEIEQLLAPHRIVGVIGSDTFQRFLREGIAKDFQTDEIVVSERESDPLSTAPARLEGRPVWYIGRTKLAYNTDCSTSIRSALVSSVDNPVHPMLNHETYQLAHTRQLYKEPKPSAATAYRTPQIQRDIPRYTTPELYRDCSVELMAGLENGLLSESFVFQIRDTAGALVAFMKMLPPERHSLSHLRDEAHGLALFNRLGLQTATAPEAILTTDPPSLWVTRAPGDTVGSLIISYERGVATAEEVYEALYAVGACLKELHTRHGQPFDAKGAELLETYIAHHQAFIDGASPVDLQSKLIQGAIGTFHREASYLRTKGLRCSLIHGDASTSNVLWEKETKRLSVIDMQRLGTQARTGAPAFSIHEYRSFLTTLTYFPNIGFKGERGPLGGACAAYQAGYGPVDQHEDRFFKALRFIRKELGGPERVHEITRPSASTHQKK